MNKILKTESDVYNFIPIEKELDAFKAYLNGHEKVILSARFGDGKTTFLQELYLKAENDKFEYITVYPVNYQVAENTDIFEYIKRDILMQILYKVELSTVDINNSWILWDYVMKNKLSILSDGIGLLAEIPNLTIPGLGLATKGLGILLSNLKALKEHKSSLQENEEYKAELFINAFENQQGSIYEFDAITQLICRINKSIKKNESTLQTVLVIEDLDRLDPAHTFRILNILSAHIERRHQSLTDWETTHGKNKFMFDKIVLVCDYKNIKEIYHHLYGEKTDFEGYISKFSSAAPFHYSLRDKYKDYIIKKIEQEICDSPEILSLVADLILDPTLHLPKSSESSLPNTSFPCLRKIDNLFIDDFSIIKREDIVIEDTLSVSTLNDFTKLLYILDYFEITIERFLSGISKRNDSVNLRQILYQLIDRCWLLSPEIKLKEIDRENKIEIGVVLITIQPAKNIGNEIFNAQNSPYVKKDLLPSLYEKVITNCFNSISLSKTIKS